VATSRHLWVRDLLAALDVPGSYYNALAVIAQCQAEGGTARFNPLNTTLKMPGSTAYGPDLGGGVRVQHYTSMAQGLEATLATLRQTNMAPLLTALKSGTSSTAYWKALGVSPWGTHPPGGLTIEAWLDDCRRHWYEYAMVPVAGT
jgi:hypothetical protein